MSDEEKLDIFDDNEGEQPVDAVNDQAFDDQQVDELLDLNLDDAEFDDLELEKYVEGNDDKPSKRIQKKRKSSSGGNNVEAKQQKPRSSKKEEERLKNELEIKEEVKKIKSEMKQIHQRDIKAVENKKPALNKIKHIDEIISKLSKLGVQREFVQDKGIDYLADWLDKIPNGPEPSVTLRKKLLQFIFELNVTRSNLTGIRLGKVIYKISSKSEVKELRILANKVVEKWSKIINSRDKKYDDEDQYEYGD
ncbi:TFIIS helical bundle-like domain protein (macronuclear) [Tetrahymena thermophila SB210]|uniref:TFIIS helical bundle-like domain protein n=1 Tax=Tetrahymena thermophila (strain SB210) TaxID=312017 RepID=I7MET8_TETTS|nr:TFIIS helical bundle-like domain protein [Tetrahymena thermophila SB210]EAR97582.2 TFIIS helical bundle-like domain protein [Tetrahymena thermophila SB210]|eukprot:XP_001017827.2 TFIIS helical bundle-like domain protein [Tetrahymena thermophila SB210]